MKKSVLNVQNLVSSLIFFNVLLTFVQLQLLRCWKRVYYSCWPRGDKKKNIKMAVTSVSAEFIEQEDVLKIRRQSIDNELYNLSLIKPFGYIWNDRYLNYHQRIQDFEIFEDDVFIATQPRSGMFFFVFFCPKRCSKGYHRIPICCQ